MFLKSNCPSHEITVNLYRRFINGQQGTNIWKMQKAPANNIRVGQRIWFESEIFATGKSAERDMGGGRTIGVKQYSGEVLGISGWERNWVLFSVGMMGKRFSSCGCQLSGQC
jgi:hypothetical protein